MKRGTNLQRITWQQRLAAAVLDVEPERISRSVGPVVEELLRRLELSDSLLLKNAVRDVAILRYRCEGQKTLGETGREFGLTRERVRHVEQTQLERLRQPTLSRRLTPYLQAGMT